jgi:hypothetical protein
MRAVTCGPNKPMAMNSIGNVTIVQSGKSSEI